MRTEPLSKKGMAILLPQRVAVTLTHGDVWSCPGSGGEQRNFKRPFAIAAPAPCPAARHDHAAAGRSQARRRNEMGIRIGLGAVPTCSVQLYKALGGGWQKSARTVARAVIIGPP